MNARYALTDEPIALGKHFGIVVTDNFPARYNIAPSQPVPIIRATPDAERHYSLVRWGFVPAWDRMGNAFKKAVVNIRSETAAEKPSFRHAWRRRHCLFPMNAMYEWQTDEKGVKHPLCIAKDETMPLFALAGLWEEWQGADGSEMTTAAFLTRPSVGALTQLHHRVPVFVAPDRYDDWLLANETDDTIAKEIIAAPPPDLTWWPVSRAVNSWKPDNPDLLKRIPPPTKQESLF